MNKCRSLCVLLMTFVLFGCLGIAHQSVDVPVLRILAEGDSLNSCGDIQSAVFVSPVFYGVPDSFRDLMANEIEDGIYYASRSPGLNNQGEFLIKFPSESRYVGYLATPFTRGPGQDITTSRVVFIKFRQAAEIFKIELKGDRAIVQRLQNIDSLGARPERPDGEEELGEYSKRVVAFFQSARWQGTDALRVRNIERDDAVDSFSLEFQPSLCANKGFNRTPASSGPAKPGEFGGGAG